MLKMDTTIGVATPVRTRPTTDDFVPVVPEGWYCLATLPWSCSADGCTFVAEFVTAAHLIVVWPERDDPELLNTAAIAQKHGRDPRVVEYLPEFGPCIPYDRWQQLGRPVHSIRRGQ